MTDSRQKTYRRLLKLELIDEHNLPFSNEDFEWIADNVEELLQQRFEVKVDAIDLEKLEDKDGDNPK